MMNVATRIAGLALAVTLSSCAYSPQVIRLDPASPTLETVTVSSGEGPQVVLVTRDARRVPEIGRRGTGSSNAAITTDTDIAELLQSRASEILSSKGYRVVPAGPPSVPTLEVQLDELTYRTIEEAGKRKVRVFVLLGTQVRGARGTYRKSYEVQQDTQFVFEPVAKTNEEWINETFATALKQLAHDPKLYSFLE